MNTVLFSSKNKTLVFLLQLKLNLGLEDIDKLEWLFQASVLEDNSLKGTYLGYRREMVSPWCTNACDMIRNMGIKGVTRVEQYKKISQPQDNCVGRTVYDHLLEEIFVD